LEWKITNHQELKSNLNSGTLAVTQFKPCCFPVFLEQQNLRLKRKILILSLALYSLAVKRGLSYKRKRRVLRRIFVNRKEEVAGDWKKLHNEKLHNLYCLQNVIMLNRGERDSLDI
jgi:hypothetical protein